MQSDIGIGAVMTAISPGCAAPALSSMPPPLSPRGLQVREAGRALKVQHAEVPHLVSLGGGRLSTSVTLHPLPQGRVLIGCSDDVDIRVEGTGVERHHCLLENNSGVVTLTPLAQNTSIDGVPVTASTRLTQGSMLGIGRSNFFKFNHPAEANYMKSVMPANTRISMMQPLVSPMAALETPNYSLQTPIGLNKPPVRGTKPWTEDWINNSISPKVFHADTVTVNSPASAVLGQSPLGMNASGSSFVQRTSSPSPLLGNGASAHRRTLSAGSGRLSQTERGSPLMTRASPVPCSPSLSGHGGSSCSLQELMARGEELELRRLQAQEERLKEQEAERLERARLEEILTMCAEYERQQQQQQQNPEAGAKQQPSPPPPSGTPPVHQNRIKTNGSLPRDKRLPSPRMNDSPAKGAVSPGKNLTASEDELSQIFTFDAPRPGTSPQQRSPYENVYPQSPRTRIRTTTKEMENAPPKPPLPKEIANMPLLKAIEAQNRATSSDRFIRPLGTCDGALEPHLKQMGGSLPNSPAPNFSHGVRRRSMEEAEQMKRERSRILSSMSNIKRTVAEIQLHEEELVRELEMERALIDGEWQMQCETFAQEEEHLLELRLRLEQLDRDISTARLCEARHLADCRARMEQGELEVRRLEQQLVMCRGSREDQMEISEQLRHQQEILEAERKTFEDQEFQHMEQEAMWEAGREELSREIGDVMANIEERKATLIELESQREEAAEAAMNHTELVERQLDTPLKQLEEGRFRLREIEAHLKELTKEGVVPTGESSPEGSSEADEISPQPSPQKSSALSPQELGERISQVTSQAPIDMKNGSLGRKTIESLKEIEKNRQLLLAKQGREVIEEERNRVQALKRRVQDEVRAQWEERRQREANCNSLNSVGSEESTSSDMPTESASSDEAVEKQMKPATESPTSSQEEKDLKDISDPSQVKQQEAERDLSDTRPLSDSSSYEDQLSVRLRDAKLSPRAQQRPLTRYLPIRSEALDLKAHIESAGHQVELCNHVVLDNISCRGYLHKMGSKFRTWQRRWFVFDRTKRCFTYYSDRNEKKARGGAYFQAIEEVYVDHLNSVKSPHPGLTFCVKCSERTYHLMAPSAEAMRIWIDVIFTGAEGYQEFGPS
ncbi:pleckstrin homology-like domain family B member 1 isoform X3 [Cloeon dipterum]|uniref:pleckstrin homology-like domain family B member 1 isoform X3 n=1 Tax=Cloeon dipterum TaxID=197152 RepID=UPI00321FFA4E